MAKLDRNDLDFILKQIKIAEDHTALIAEGVDPREALEQLVSSPLLPFGLRTVDGSFNNFQPNMVHFGAGDEAMTRLLTPDYNPAETNPRTGESTSYEQFDGSVYDSQPRVISNLIADQSIDNPAAIAGALASVGITGAQALQITGSVMALRAEALSLRAQIENAQDEAQAAYDAADAALTSAIQTQANAQSNYDLALAAQASAQLNVDNADAALASAIAAQDAYAPTLSLVQAAAATALAAVQAAQAIAATTQDAANLTAAQLASAQSMEAAALLAFQANPTVANANAYAAAVDVREDAALAHGLAVEANEDADAALVDAQSEHSAAVSAVQTAFTQVQQLDADVNLAQANLQSAQAALGSATVALADATETLDLATEGVAAATAAREAIPLGEAATAAAEAAADAADAAVIAELSEHGVSMDQANVFIKNIAADLGDTASFNGFMTIFGQFFDHGLDLTAKGGSGTVYIPLHPDDPLYDPASFTNFMVLTRATNEPGADGVLGTADDVREHRNETTPWTDLNQVYTSNPSHQVFLREYILVEGKPIATGHMLEGDAGGPPTWADIKEQAREMLGIELDDLNVHSVPLLATDLYGEFLRGPSGLPQIVTANGLVEGNRSAPIDALDALSAGRAFLNDIAHNAAPGSYTVSQGQGGTVTGIKTADTDDEIGNEIVPNMYGGNATYDDELLDQHFIVGDGRGNENIVLTAVHTMFHGEHNRQVDAIKATVIAEGDLAFLNQWLLVDVTEIPADLSTLVWDGERLFQASRFSTEMVYQHLVFEEFVRAIAPQIDPFVFSNSVELDGAIFEEFAQVVYRFGHSMLNETVEMLNFAGGAASPSEMGLIDAFLNPMAFAGAGGNAEEAAGAILRGMTRQAGNEIDEFMTGALRNNLVGLPLDLAALNIARARETGIPSLNEARRQIYSQTNDSYLKPYESWVDYAQNIKNPLSIVNFIAAYGTHASILAATTAEAKRDAAWTLVFGGEDAPADRLDFLNSTGTWASQETGLNMVDFWIGGLAEALMPFGGMLGSTFTFVFELQIQNLQNGDRFYYLSRTQGMNLLTELESDSFADLIRRNTDTEDTGLHINGAAFQTADFIIEMDQTKQYNQGLGSADPSREADVISAITGNSSLVVRRDLDNDGDIDFIQYTGGEHVVIGGTNEDDFIIGGAGDDTIWGEDGDDRIEGGYGVDHIHGGEGDDIITDSGTDIGDADVIKGEGGDDVINGGMGLDLIFGGDGNDVLSGGSEDKAIFGGHGNDFIRSASGGGGVIYGNEGDDWMEGQGNMNTLTGDNSQLFFNSRIIGHDIMLSGENDTDFDAESGDDIMVQGIGINRNNGMAGFDWTTFQGNNYAADADMNVSIFVNQQNNILRDRYDLVEGLSGWDYNDKLVGREVVTGAYDANGNATQIDADAPIASFSNALLEKNLHLIDGLADLVAHLQRFEVYNPHNLDVDGNPIDPNGAHETAVMDTSDGSDILLGGGGSDTIRGMAGNDIIDGDKWLSVRIAINDANGVEFATASRLTGQVFDLSGNVLFDGRTLESLLFSRDIRPSQLEAKREILDGGKEGDVDTAVYWDVLANYTITSNSDGSITVEHVNPTIGAIDTVSGRNLEAEGTDRLFNIERLQFADQTITFSAPKLFLQQASGQYADTFNSSSFGNSNGATAWVPVWQETGDSGGVTSGQIQIDNGGNALRLSRGAGNDASNNGAMITRTMDLSGASTATISYTAAESGLEPGEWVRVYFAANGTDFVLVNEITSAHPNSASHTHNVTGPFAANAAIRFEVSAMSSTDDIVTIDNLAISFTGEPTQSFAATFTEGGPDQDIASNPLILEDGEIVSARIVLTNAQAGDSFDIPNNLPGNINSSVANVGGQIVVTLTGNEPNLAQWQAALQAIEFRNNSQNPSATPRVIEVTVNDGFLDSNVAVTTITVVPVNDAPNASNDAIITNFAGNFNIPFWALLANDSDLDGDALTITNVTENQTSFSVALGNGLVEVSRSTTQGRQFNYTVSDGQSSDAATASISYDSGNITANGNGSQILIGDGGNDTFSAGGGNDVISAGGGNDTIDAGTGDDLIGWTVGDGSDFVNGNSGIDTIRVIGDSSAESYTVYSRQAWDAIPGNIGSQLNNATEIVITRNGSGFSSIIAQLDNVEEIIIDGMGGGDTITTVGNFNGTSLLPNTITINGSADNDTFDISALESIHRVVIRSNGGNDTVIGTLRAQDTIELPEGVTDYTTTTTDGLTTISFGGNTITFAAPSDGTPNIRIESDDDDEEDEHHDDYDDHEEDDDQDHDDDDTCDSDDEDDVQSPGTVTPPPAASGPIIGTALADVLVGTIGKDLIFGMGGVDYIVAGSEADTIRGDDGDDFIYAEEGRDVVFGGEGDDDVFGGEGDDALYGEDGDDWISGDAGNDMLDGGLGHDSVFGGEGNDMFIARNGDGNDHYDGGAGVDTLDMGSISGDLNVDLGTGIGGRGSVTGTNSGTDALYGIENVTTGSGNDTIVASTSVNVMDGGSGNDIFVFRSAAAADGDTIVGFEAGDRIDLSGIDANTGTAGVQSFTLVSGQASAPGQLTVSHESREDGDFTIISGNTGGDNDPEFRIELTGNHTLTSSDFNL